MNTLQPGLPGNVRRSQSKGVFEGLVSGRAFIDKIYLVIEGAQRRRKLETLHCQPSIAIGGPGRPYARSVHATNRRTLNPVELRYGPNPLFRNLATMSLCLRSEGQPLTASEIADSAAALIRNGFRMRVSRVELTCDVNCASVRELDAHLVTRAERVLHMVDSNGHKTLYVGAPASPWQLRIYDKAPGIVRVEFVLKNRFLREKGIAGLMDICRLRELDFNRLASFQDFDYRELNRIFQNIDGGWRKDIRSVPMSSRCNGELLRWRERLGPEFSQYVFANPQQPETHLRDVRRAWPDALKAAGLEYFWLYDLRHTFASRLTQAGVSPLFVAQIMGHSSPGILQTYAKAIDEYRRSAISKLESFLEAQSIQSAGRSEKDRTTLIQ
ncbi:MAG: xerD 1 [Acidobacteriaceae bacterium]|nr:xerD 1 [Acidobacteriaceae bacterium]